MVNMARHAANNEALSYRDFHVGASAYAITFDGAKAPTITGGANYKPDEDSPKYCAEMDIIDQAEEDSFDQIIGMVVAGTNDPKKIYEVMGREAATLHPCDMCRDKMHKSRLIVPDTLVVTVALEEDVAQVHTFDELKMIYDMSVRQARGLVHRPVELDLDNWGERIQAFDRGAQASPDIDPTRLARLVLTNTV
jgi:cytidine deaminase